MRAESRQAGDGWLSGKAGMEVGFVWRGGGRAGTGDWERGTGPGCKSLRFSGLSSTGAEVVWVVEIIVGLLGRRGDQVN